MEVSRLVEYMNEKTSKTALDIGCGGGRNSILLAENGFIVDSIDRNKIAL
jgi:2-polyprenyl-3-methyl-5-hydroxy-6-metoxy-1,4-benzoquinol methylase